MNLYLNEQWRQLAACHDQPTALFYPDGVWDRPKAAEARAVCNACPVRPACLEYALTHHEKYGMWGGLTPAQRQKYLRRTSGHPTATQPINSQPAAVVSTSTRPATLPAHQRH